MSFSFAKEKLNQKKGESLKQKRNEIEIILEKAGVRKHTQVSPFLFGIKHEKRKALKRKRKTKQKRKIREGLCDFKIHKKQSFLACRKTESFSCIREEFPADGAI